MAASAAPDYINKFLLVPFDKGGQPHSGGIAHSQATVTVTTGCNPPPVTLSYVALSFIFGGANWKIARNHLISYFRRVRPEVPLEEDDPPEDDFDSLTLQQRQALVSEQAAGHSIEDCVRKAFVAFEKG